MKIKLIRDTDLRHGGLPTHRYYAGTVIDVWAYNEEGFYTLYGFIHRYEAEELPYEPFTPDSEDQ